MLSTFPNQLSRTAQIELFGHVHTICPFDHAADTSLVTLSYQPDALGLEMTSFGAYLATWNGTTISHELLAEAIFTALWDALKPHWLMVTDDFNRNGVRLRVRFQSDLPERRSVRPS